MTTDTYGATEVDLQVGDLLATDNDGDLLNTE